ncbi:MAG: S8 family serine peptidase, partial [Bacteroidota bacterium]|nr:S8 family serine peptidase [Bacteroidota bacterium]
YQLTESNNMVVVRTKKGKTLSEAITSTESEQATNKLKVQLQIKRSDVTILEVKKTQKDPLAVRNEVRTSLKKEKDIEFAGRVLIDPDTKKPVIYTENVFIRFNPDTSVSRQKEILATHKLTIKQKIKFSHNTYFVQTPKNTGVEVFDICKKILRMKEVDYCEPELIRNMGEKKVLPKIYNRQWHLKSTKIGKRKINASAGVAKAHQITMGEGSTISIIDDGVDIAHCEFNLPGKIVAPRDVSYNINDAMPKNWDDNHGTCCAGVACASGLHKVCGVAPAAKLIPIRNVSQLGSKDEAFAIAWAVDHGADVISCSWGPEDGAWWSTRDKLHGRRHPISALTNDAIHYAISQGRNGKGCVIVFAAGNGNEDCDPDKYVSHPEVIAVAACNDRGKKSVYSDYGKSVWVCFPSNDYEAANFHHAAPLTTGIWTTDRAGRPGHRKKHLADYCDNFGGTSSACPGVAGVCALILSVNSNLTWVDVKDILRLSADKIDIANGMYDEDGHSEWYGYGRVNAAKAVEIAKKLGHK